MTIQIAANHACDSSLLPFLFAKSVAPAASSDPRRVHRASIRWSSESKSWLEVDGMVDYHERQTVLWSTPISTVVSRVDSRSRIASAKACHSDTRWVSAIAVFVRSLKARWQPR